VKKINKNHRLGGPSIYSERLEREAKILSNLSHPNIIGFRAFKPGRYGSSLVEPEPRAERSRKKLPPGAGAEITNCGSGSFLFITDLKKFYRKKSWLLNKIL
jgi:hypothetical protein